MTLHMALEMSTSIQQSTMAAAGGRLPHGRRERARTREEV
jgi:hypothetical protein